MTCSWNPDHDCTPGLRFCNLCQETTMLPNLALTLGCLNPKNLNPNIVAMNLIKTQQSAEILSGATSLTHFSQRQAKVAKFQQITNEIHESTTLNLPLDSWLNPGMFIDNSER